MKQASPRKPWSSHCPVWFLCSPVEPSRENQHGSVYLEVHTEQQARAEPEAGVSSLETEIHNACTRSIRGSRGFSSDGIYNSKIMTRVVPW